MVGISGPLPECLQPAARAAAGGDWAAGAPPPPVPRLDRSGVLWVRLLGATAAAPGAAGLA